ncbi:hypothetical protein [Paenibacillus alba]|uniref:Uncharacterized protein n=1 Tax=Paenibacillus alba TaxID=1197127 RepID=A0ABU6FXT7_9BACL|nr:hypothetical protein [Paenibacillus alba]MEC0226730.1 hypothetical protein [Paenibacillus alba]
MPTEKEKEMINFINSYEGNVDASLEEQVMADSLKLMRLSLMDIYFMNTLAELDPSKGKDFSEELKAIFKTSQELSEYFSKQGLKHEVK